MEGVAIVHEPDYVHFLVCVLQRLVSMLQVLPLLLQDVP
jgi:hypothetical protein